MNKFLILTAVAAMVLVAGATWADLKFDHEVHADEELDCVDCHTATPPGANWEAPMPVRATCLECHEDEDLAALPMAPSSHLGDYLYQHQYEARNNGGDCSLCHLNQESCTVCHHGENVDFLTHDRNWRYFHSMAYYKRTQDCFVCHDPRTSCQQCHAANGVKPGTHFMQGWSLPEGHGQQARTDLSSCIQCHDGPHPVCKDCHN